MYEEKSNVIMNSFETIVSKFFVYFVHFSTWFWIRICIPAMVVLTILTLSKVPDSSETGLFLSVFYFLY